MSPLPQTGLEAIADFGIDGLPANSKVVLVKHITDDIWEMHDKRTGKIHTAKLFYFTLTGKKCKYPNLNGG